jgi:hypothetical protein
MSASHRKGLHPDAIVTMGGLGSRIIVPAAGLGVFFLLVTLVLGLMHSEERARAKQLARHIGAEMTALEIGGEITRPSRHKGAVYIHVPTLEDRNRLGAVLAKYQERIETQDGQILTECPAEGEGGPSDAARAATVCITGAQAYVKSMSRFFHSYLVAFVFFLAIALGALFFVIIQHLVRARWSVVVRRLAEILTSTLPLMGVLSLVILIPMLLGHQGLYTWTDDDFIPAGFPDAGGYKHLIHDKHAYLNVPFFAARVLVYFGLWCFMAHYFFRKSVDQDLTADRRISDRLRAASGPAIIVFALTLAFAAFDLMMTLDPLWFSTIFGVYYFAGAAMSIMCVLILAGLLLQRSGRLKHVVSVEHYHDLGKLTFAFVFFWSYIAFSQFMLIWYANLPETTNWYYYRMFTSWKGLSLLLLVGHFAFPFLMLLSRETKRRVQVLGAFCVWLLFMQLCDMFWLVMPLYDRTGFNSHPMDVTAVLGIGGLFVALAVRTAGKVNLVPTKDPHLGHSVNFENY